MSCRIRKLESRSLFNTILQTLHAITRLMLEHQGLNFAIRIAPAPVTRDMRHCDRQALLTLNIVSDKFVRQTFTDMPRRVRIQDVIRSELPPEFLKQDIQLLQSFLLCAPPTTRSSGNTRFLPQAVCFTRSTSSRIVHVHDRVQYLDRMIFIIHLDCTEAD